MRNSLKRGISSLVISIIVVAALIWAGATIVVLQGRLKEAKTTLATTERIMVSHAATFEHLINKVETLERRIAAPPIPGQPRDFRDMAELYQFLAEDKTDKLQWRDPEHLCTEFTLKLAENATKKGYRIFPVLLVSHQGNHITGLHSMNFALVDDYGPDYEKYRYIMVIEPQSDEVWIFGRFAKDDESKKIELVIEKLYPFLPF